MLREHRKDESALIERDGVLCPIAVCDVPGAGQDEPSGFIGVGLPARAGPSGQRGVSRASPRCPDGGANPGSRSGAVSKPGPPGPGRADPHRKPWAAAPGLTVGPMNDDRLAFWRERHLCTLTTIRPDGSPHVVPVGVTFDPGAGIARVITDGTSRKARNVERAGAAARAAVCQVDGGRWATLEGTAVVRRDRESVAEAERRYAERYRTPSPNPGRVVIEITVDRILGRA